MSTTLKPLSTGLRERIAKALYEVDPVWEHVAECESPCAHPGCHYLSWDELDEALRDLNLELADVALSLAVDE